MNLLTTANLSVTMPPTIRSLIAEGKHTVSTFPTTDKYWLVYGPPSWINDPVKVARCGSGWTVRIMKYIKTPKGNWQYDRWSSCEIPWEEALIPINFLVKHCDFQAGWSHPTMELMNGNNP